MASYVEEDDRVKAAYVMGTTQAEVFRAAAQWVASQDGAFTIDGVRWRKNPVGDYELGIFYESVEP
jgi:hypothetical protein